MNLQLDGKKALVTGSTAGIGFAIARSLAREGASVVITGRTQERVDEATKSIRQEIRDAKISGIAANLATPNGISKCIEALSTVDVLVNNLGVYEVKPFEQITDGDWHSIIETNFMSGVRLSRHYLPRMKAANWGRIIFISSESAVNIPVEMIHYGVTKAVCFVLSSKAHKNNCALVPMKAMRGRIALQKHFVRNPRKTLIVFRASFRTAHASSRRF